MTDASRSVRVLVVDDNSIIADALAELMRIRGYDAVAVYSAEGALKSCRERCADAVICDVSLEPMNGFQLAVQLSQTFPLCKVLLMTSNVRKESRVRGSNAGGDTFPLLRKPRHLGDILPFVAAVEAIIEPCVCDNEPS
jgi:two-component system OmpR family response regulator